MHISTIMRAGLLASVGLTAPAWAQTAPAGPQAGDYQAGQFLFHLDAAGVFKEASAKVYVEGNRIPGASISSGDDPTITFDLDYFVTPHLALDLYAGLPPRGVIKGAGTIKGFGTLATTNYGPAVVSAEYRFDTIDGISPYIAAGVNYTLFLNVHHEALYNVKIPNAFGAAFKVGLDYRITPAWSVNVYAMQILLGTHVSASADPGRKVPAVAKAVIDPVALGAGFGYAF